MQLTKLHLALAIGAAMFTTSAMAGPGPQTWPTGFPTVVKTEAQAMKCCLPKEKVALACKDCKTVNEKGGEFTGATRLVIRDATRNPLYDLTVRYFPVNITLPQGSYTAEASTRVGGLRGETRFDVTVPNAAAAPVVLTLR